MPEAALQQHRYTHNDAHRFVMRGVHDLNTPERKIHMVSSSLRSTASEPLRCINLDTGIDLSGRRGGVFESSINELEALGYESKWRVMLAADYGAPQLRERVIVVAMKSSNAFQFPSPTNGSDASDLGLSNLPHMLQLGV